MKLEYIVTENNIYTNIKEVLKAYFGISDRLLLKLKNNERIFLNSKKTYIDSRVIPNDKIEVYLDFEENNSNIPSTKMDLNIIYEDDSYIIINKPSGIPVHPSIKHFSDSLSSGIKYYFDSINLHRKIRPVNRLDKDTSGLVVFAKNAYIQECLVKQMKSKEFKKEYIAICNGILDEKSGIIDAPISRKENSIIERCVNNSGDKAITYYEVLQEINDKNNPYSIVKCKLETGRTHQIRVHMQYIGHSLLGDTLYGSSSSLIFRQALHSYKIEFIHPINKEKVSYTSPIPDDMKILFK